MTQLTLQFLQILVLILSIGSVEHHGSSGAGVAAMPVSRRGSMVDPSIAVDDRSLASPPRVGLAVKADTNTNFPSLETRSDDPGAPGSSVPLKRLESSSKSHPQMLLQHHLNRANAKLAHMQKRGSFSEQDRQAALLRRRASILSDVERRSVSMSERTPKSNGRVGLPGGGRGGISGETKSRREEESSEDAAASERSLKAGAEAHNLLPQIGDSSSKATSGGDTATKQAASYKNLKAQSGSSESATSTVDTSKNKSSGNQYAASKTSPYDIASNGFPTAAQQASSASGLIKAKTPDTQGSLALDIEANDVGYIATFGIGTAGNFSLLVDSGSADTWVPSTVCTNCSSVHHKLGKSTSKTFAAISPQKAFKIAYGTGDVSGHLGNDTLQISGYKLNHTFGLATTESSDFSDSSVPFDGLMGLAKSQLSSSGTPTPIEQLYSTGQVAQPVMGYHLGRASDGSNDGEVTFGGVDPFKFKGDLTEVENVSTEGFWEAKLDAVSFNGSKISLSGSYSRSAILDTGTTLIVAPQADADALHTAIPGAKSDGQGGYTIPCTTAGQVSFSFGGKTWPMDARDMTFLPLDDNNLKGDCISAISAGNVGQKGEWLVGAAFLKNVYFATNTKSNTIALGELA